MARGKIAGVTLELNADTTKLQKALKDVNKTSRDLKTELNYINKSLKFNPGNADLIAQKQRVLGESIKNTKANLDLLRQTQEKAQEAFARGDLKQDEYDQLTRRILTAENQLKSFTTELDQLNSKSYQVGESLKDIGGKFENAGKKMKTVSLVAAAQGGAMVKMALDFNDAIAKLSTIADASVPISELRKEIIELSNDTGVASSEIANSVYDAISAGRDTADAVDFVRQSTMLAKAGFSDTAATTDLLTTALNAYGLEASKTTELSDMLIQTQNRGKIKVGELAGVMGKVIPVASAANVQMDELSTAFVFLTKNGIAVAESSTYLRAMFAELTKTGSKSDEMLKEISGKSFPELKAEGKTTAEILQMLSDGAQESGLNLKDMFGSTQAGTAALTLLKDGVSGYNEELKMMNESTGATEEAFQKVKTPATEFKNAINRLKNAMIEIGTQALPFIEKLANGISSLAKFFANLSPGMQKFIMLMTGILAVSAPLLIFIGKLTTGLGSIIEFFSAGGAGATAFGAIMSKLPMLLSPTNLAIIAIVGAGIYLIKHWDDVKAMAAALADWIGEKWENIKNWTSEKWNNIKESISGAWEKVKTSVSNGVKSVGEKMSTKWDELKEKTSTTWGNIKESIGNAWSNAKENTKNALVTLGESILSKWTELDGTTQEKWEAIKQGILAPIEKAKEGVKNALEKMKSFFKFEWQLPKIKLPHFKKVGTGFLGLPKIGVEWYDKGGIFNSPSIIGVGEKRPEFVGALDDLKEIVGEVVRKEGSPQGAGVLITGNTFVVRTDDDIRRIAEELNNLQMRQARGGLSL